MVKEVCLSGRQVTGADMVTCAGQMAMCRVQKASLSSLSQTGATCRSSGRGAVPRWWLYLQEGRQLRHRKSRPATKSKWCVARNSAFTFSLIMKLFDWSMWHWALSVYNLIHVGFRRALAGFLTKELADVSYYQFFFFFLNLKESVVFLKYIRMKIRLSSQQ